MKKTMLLALCAAFLLSACGSYTATGAYTGSTLGSILGSAIGGLSGGPRGSDWGQIIGMAGGAVVGGAIGNAADKAQERKLDRYHERVLQKNDQKYKGNRDGQYYNDNSDDSGFDPSGRADDRIDLDISAPKDNTYHEPSATAPATTNLRSVPPSEAIQISNIRFVDDDLTLRSNEQSKIVFELRNVSDKSVYHVQPVVVETSGNKHIMVSPGIEVESIAPGSGIKYTAAVVTDKKLKEGTATFEISVTHDKQTTAPDVKVLTINTSR